MIKINSKIENISLTSKAKETLLKYSKKTKETNKEYGGVLLGTMFENGRLTIEIVTEPTIFDISESLSFIRMKKSVQRKIINYWKKSNGTINYIGEWHSHPFASSKPSCCDVDLLKKIVSNEKNSFDIAIMIIVSNNMKYSIYLIDNKDKIIREVNKDE